MKRIDFLLDHGVAGKMRDDRRKMLEKRKRQYALMVAHAGGPDEFALWTKYLNEVEQELRSLR